MNTRDLKEVLIKTTKILAGGDIKVYMEGFQPRVEYDAKTKKPTNIFIPALPDNASSKLVDAIHGYIDHECSHIKFSDSEDICDASKDKLWHYIHNCIEDPRVNRAISNFYPGSGENIKRGYEYLFKDIHYGKEHNPYSNEYLDSLDLTDGDVKAKFWLQYASLWFAGQMNCPVSSEKYEELNIKGRFAELEAKADKSKLAALKSIKSAADVRAVTDYFTEFFSQAALDELMPDEGKNKNGGEGESDEVGEGCPIDPSGSTFDDKAKEKLKKLSESIKTLEEELAEKIKGDAEEAIREAGGYFYWTDRFDKKFSKHDIMKNAGARRGRGLTVASFEEDTKRTSNYIIKDLRRLLEERRRRYYIGGYKSGKLNSKSLYSVRTGNDRVFKKKNEIRDVNACVSLLVDMSGSMSCGRIEIAMKAAYALAMALTTIKVPFEIYGFMTEDPNHKMTEEWNKYRDMHSSDIVSKVVNQKCPERVYAFKEFDDNFDIISKTALTATGNGQTMLIQNEDSKHVGLAIERLAARQERVKTLFVFSDGEPAYCAHSMDPSNAKLRNLVKNAKQDHNVDVYGIGIQSYSVKKFYDKYAVVDDLSVLPQTLFDFLKKVI